MPGALDWDSKVTVDHRVKWPLDLTWFGGPGPARMMQRNANRAPVIANGNFFIFTYNYIVGLDAYNGLELWSRKIPKAYTISKSVDDTSLYLKLKEGYVQLNARTGRITATSISIKISWQDASDKPVLKTKEELEKAFKIGRVRIPMRNLRTKKENQSPQIKAVFAPRTHPLTGEKQEKTYRRGMGCGPTTGSATMDIFRSGSLGFYDFIEDSGRRNFAGIRPGCRVNVVPALGIIVSPEGSAGCKCNYNFQISLGFGPAKKRRNEDWSLFYAPPTRGPIVRASLNLASPFTPSLAS